MSLTYRFKRLIKSDLHAFVEGLEDSRWVLAQALRDMEEELEKLDGAVTAKQSHLLKLKENISVGQEKIAQWDHDIEFAMQEKREDIAKTLIKKWLLQKQSLEVFNAEQKNCTEELKALQDEVKQKQDAYDDICSRATQVAQPKAEDNAFTEADRLVPHDETLEQQVDLEFLRRIQPEKEGQDAS